MTAFKWRVMVGLHIIQFAALVLPVFAQNRYYTHHRSMSEMACLLQLAVWYTSSL
jgi:hypothetical protein